MFYNSSYMYIISINLIHYLGGCYRRKWWFAIENDGLELWESDDVDSENSMQNEEAFPEIKIIRLISVFCSHGKQFSVYLM